MHEVDPVEGAYSAVHAHTYRLWCEQNLQDPDSLDAILAYEDLFDETDTDQYQLFTDVNI